ncbi:MAG: glutamine--tRNA ligase/YqeY domain fusion protein [Spirochaetes bacterium]|nr:glutamine--tRNA ligase/YqeY domain fusion protein [Spirochaetota bacterium]
MEKKNTDIIAKKDENLTGLDFIREIIRNDLKQNKNNGQVITRFPPEPNGYLHIGHAKAIVLNFSVAEEFKGRCHLRFDDTNPTKEEMEYIDAIKKDIRWLGYDWDDHEYYASDYFEKIYDYAVQLVKKGKAYVDTLTSDEIREYRGTLTQAGKDSPYRNRSVEENLSLLEKMRNGEMEEGACVLRARIDMASGNINMRDPSMYRILKASHPKTGDKWCIYPMYDFAHPLSDAIESITHSLCTLEFEDHRPLYDWFLDQLSTPAHPRQIEFARLNITYTVLSKRKLLHLVSEGHVKGWDDPRMPTLSGLRRRGYTPESIKVFCNRIGVAKSNSVVDIALLEHCLREDLNKTANRVMVVLRPLKVIIDNYPDEKVEELDAINNPEDESMGKRTIPFSKVIYIEREDFKEDPPKKFFRLAIGREVRLKHAYYIRCESIVKDEKTGDIIELHCTYDPRSKGGWTEDGRKVMGTLHWVSTAHAIKVQVNLYDHLFLKEDPENLPEGSDFTSNLNPRSMEIIKDCFAEPSLKNAQVGDRFQFLRQGYFCLDPDTSSGRMIFNRIVNLRDSWAKIEKSILS